MELSALKDILKNGGIVGAGGAGSAFRFLFSAAN